MCDVRNDRNNNEIWLFGRTVDAKPLRKDHYENFQALRGFSKPLSAPGAQRILEIRTPRGWPSNTLLRETTKEALIT